MYSLLSALLASAVAVLGQQLQIFDKPNGNIVKTGDFLVVILSTAYNMRDNTDCCPGLDLLLNGAVVWGMTSTTTDANGKCPGNAIAPPSPFSATSMQNKWSYPNLDYSVTKGPYCADGVELWWQIPTGLPNSNAYQVRLRSDPTKVSNTFTIITPTVTVSAPTGLVQDNVLAAALRARATASAPGNALVPTGYTNPSGHCLKQYEYVTSTATLFMSCPNGQLISGIGTAFYGTFTGGCASAGEANPVVQRANAVGPTVLRLCGGKNSCTLHNYQPWDASAPGKSFNSIFTDPIPGIRKYLVVNWQCGTPIYPAVLTPPEVGSPETFPVVFEGERANVIWSSNAWPPAAAANLASLTLRTYVSSTNVGTGLVNFIPGAFDRAASAAALTCPTALVSCFGGNITLAAGSWPLTQQLPAAPPASLCYLRATPAVTSIGGGSSPPFFCGPAPNAQLSMTSSGVPVAGHPAVTLGGSTTVSWSFPSGLPAWLMGRPTLHLHMRLIPSPGAAPLWVPYGTIVAPSAVAPERLDWKATPPSYTSALWTLPATPAALVAGCPSPSSPALAPLAAAWPASSATTTFAAALTAACTNFGTTVFRIALTTERRPAYTSGLTAPFAIRQVLTIPPPNPAVVPACGLLNLTWPSAGVGPLTARVVLGGSQVWPDASPAALTASPTSSVLRIVSATYGAPCALQSLYARIFNGRPQTYFSNAQCRRCGTSFTCLPNVTSFFGDACNGQASCAHAFRVCDWSAPPYPNGCVGDPFPNCAKALVITYTCSASPSLVLTHTIPGEAAGKSFTLSCTQPPQLVPGGADPTSLLVRMPCARGAELTCDAANSPITGSAVVTSQADSTISTSVPFSVQFPPTVYVTTMPSSGCLTPGTSLRVNWNACGMGGAVEYVGVTCNDPSLSCGTRYLYHHRVIPRRVNIHGVTVGGILTGSAFTYQVFNDGDNDQDDLRWFDPGTDCTSAATSVLSVWQGSGLPMTLRCTQFRVNVKFQGVATVFNSSSLNWGNCGAPWPTVTSTSTLTSTPTGTRSSTGTPSVSPTTSRSASGTPSNTPPSTPSSTTSLSRTPTSTNSISATPTRSGTGSGTGTPSGTPSRTPSRTSSTTTTLTSTPSKTGTPTPPSTPSGTNSRTPSTTNTLTATPTPSSTKSLSPTPSGTGTPSNTGTGTGTGSSTRTGTGSGTGTGTPSNTATNSPTRSGTRTPTTTITGSITPSPSPTNTRTATSTPQSASPTPAPSMCPPGFCSALSSATAIKGTCPAGYLSTPDDSSPRCYKFFSDVLQWQGAQEKCRREGAAVGLVGNLATVTSMSEYAWVRSLAKGNTWIGLFDKTDGKNCPQDRTCEDWTWASGEPTTFIKSTQGQTLWGAPSANNGPRKASLGVRNNPCAGFTEPNNWPRCENVDNDNFGEHGVGFILGAWGYALNDWRKSNFQPYLCEVQRAHFSTGSYVEACVDSCAGLSYLNLTRLVDPTDPRPPSFTTEMVVRGAPPGRSDNDVFLSCRYPPGLYQFDTLDRMGKRATSFPFNLLDISARVASPTGPVTAFFNDSVALSWAGTPPPLVGAVQFSKLQLTQECTVPLSLPTSSAASAAASAWGGACSDLSGSMVDVGEPSRIFTLTQTPFSNASYCAGALCGKAWRVGPYLPGFHEAVNFKNDAGHILLHFNPRPSSGRIVLNTHTGSAGWGREESLPLPTAAGTTIDARVRADAAGFHLRLSFNGGAFSSEYLYKHRLPFHTFTNIEKRADIAVAEEDVAVLTVAPPPGSTWTTASGSITRSTGAAALTVPWTSGVVTTHPALLTTCSAISWGGENPGGRGGFDWARVLPANALPLGPPVDSARTAAIVTLNPMPGCAPNTYRIRAQPVGCAPEYGTKLVFGPFTLSPRPEAITLLAPACPFPLTQNTWFPGLPYVLRATHANGLPGTTVQVTLREGPTGGRTLSLPAWALPAAPPLGSTTAALALDLGALYPTAAAWGAAWGAGGAPTSFTATLASSTSPAATLTTCPTLLLRPTMNVTRGGGALAPPPTSPAVCATGRATSRVAYGDSPLAISWNDPRTCASGRVAITLTRSGVPLPAAGRPIAPIAALGYQWTLPASVFTGGAPTGAPGVCGGEAAYGITLQCCTNADCSTHSFNASSATSFALGTSLVATGPVGGKLAWPGAGAATRLTWAARAGLPCGTLTLSATAPGAAPVTLARGVSPALPFYDLTITPAHVASLSSGAQWALAVVTAEFIPCPGSGSVSGITLNFPLPQPCDPLPPPPARGCRAALHGHCPQWRPPACRGPGHPLDVRLPPL